MIDAKDLKIGNFVFDSDRENPYYYTVEKIQSKEYSESAEEEQNEIIGRIEGSIDGFYDIIPSPIPLTEEWLIMFGFENIQRGLFKLDVLNYGRINVHTTKSSVLVELGTYSHNLFGDTKIKYVHQLQNLYKALTNEELELK